MNEFSRHLCTIRKCKPEDRRRSREKRIYDEIVPGCFPGTDCRGILIIFLNDCDEISIISVKKSNLWIVGKYFWGSYEVIALDFVFDVAQITLHCLIEVGSRLYISVLHTCRYIHTSIKVYDWVDVAVFSNFFLPWPRGSKVFASSHMLNLRRDLSSVAKWTRKYT